jgi:hypothetical protein
MSFKPTTFDEDKLSLKPFSERLERFLLVEHDFIEGSLVVSLNAPFGSGKSTFLTMWQADLEKRRNDDTNVPLVVTLNAWESDYCGDPLLSVIAGLIKVTEDQGDKSKKSNPIREAAKDLGWFGVSILNGLVANATGLNPVDASELVERKKLERSGNKPDIIDVFEQRQTALKNLKEALRKTFGGDVPRVFVLVDELDRCRPDYAISYLETIKHVFDVHGLVFVLAVDYEQLRCSARTLFGDGLDFNEYFRKFALRSLSLPPVASAELTKLADHFIMTYFEKQNRRHSVLNPEIRIPKILPLFIGFNLTLRQIQEVFRILGHVMSGDPKKGKLGLSLSSALVLMVCLKVVDSSIYRKIALDNDYHPIAGQYLVDRLGRETAKWWVAVYITGTWNYAIQSDGDWEVLCHQLGYVHGSTNELRPILREARDAWVVQGADKFKTAYQRIETAMAF